MGKMGNDIENAKKGTVEGESGSVMEGKKSGGKCKRTTLFNIVQEQVGKFRKVEHDQNATVMERNINSGMMG